MLLPPHDSKKVGREAIYAWLRQFFKQSSKTDLSMPERQVTISGHLAVETSLDRWTLLPKGGRNPIPDEANWMGIWQRGADGVWREVRGIWNSTAPLP